MSELRRKLESYNKTKDIEKESLVRDIQQKLEQADYDIVEINAAKPWGAYIRINNDQAESFVADFFPGLTMDEARLGIEGVELSPKILVVTPGERLSWQYHDRRAERWVFLTAGGYHKSMTNDEGELQIAQPGGVVQFAQGERHRLVGSSEDYTLVAEIWQHVDTEHLSNEDDITRLADDYSR